MEYYSAIKKNTFESVLMRWMGVRFPESGFYVCCNNKSGQKQGLKPQKQIQCRVKINPSWIKRNAGDTYLQQPQSKH